ncbi:PREDICTED: F-box/WD repeat-containing protein 7-like [Branchiostoma belcheri]|uniref:F-box/WD repeat-containing protein 7-like n=1 Tax=Branchiostoma belcheri TaxID=7741 RepID=A0A6P4Z6T2_BRABE|nr:PREDICTED: F-box/WD repeat-containing protein 7-like [Branchiostoma belcheri]
MANGKRLDINVATVEDLERLKGVGRAKAEAIIEAREVQGGFDNLEALTRVPGVGTSILELNRGTLVCHTGTSPRRSPHRIFSRTLELRGRELTRPSTSRAISPPAETERPETSSAMRTPERTPPVSKTAPQKSEGRHKPSRIPVPKGVSSCIKNLMKRKSESGPDLRGLSPGKKPCRVAEIPSCSYPSLLNIHGSAHTFGDVRAPSSTQVPRRRITGVEPPPNLQDWLQTFQSWSGPERLLALDELIDRCEPTQIKHVMAVIEPQFQRDFISLLPKELALYVLSFLDPKDLLQAAQTCKYWQTLAEDTLLWREKCREAGIDKPHYGGKTPRRRSPSTVVRNPWKGAYLRQQQIDFNWRAGEVRTPKVLKGHDDHVITCLQFEGHRVVSGSDDNTLKVWSVLNGKCLKTLVGHTGGVWCSQMKYNIVISGSTDRTLKVWNADTGQCIHTLYGHTSTVRCMHLHKNQVVSGSRDATLRIWDVESGACQHVLMGHVAAVRCVQYDGRRVVSGAYDYMVKVWNPETEECLHTLQGHTNRVYSLQFDGTHIVSGSLDTSIRVWDVDSGNCLHTLIGHQSLTSGMELRDNILVSGNADSTVKIWDITTGQCLQTLQGPNKHQSAVTCLQFNKKFVITSSDDGTVKIWDLKTGEFVRNLVTLDSGGSGGVVWRVRCSNTKLVCAVGSRNGTEETKLLVLDFDVQEQDRERKEKERVM